jgi:hypothetical protein
MLRPGMQALLGICHCIYWVHHPGGTMICTALVHLQRLAAPLLFLWTSLIGLCLDELDPDRIVVRGGVPKH